MPNRLIPVKKHREIAVNRYRRARKGSMLVLGTLAAVVLAIGALAVIKSHSRRIAVTEAEVSSVQTRLTSHGLLHRCIAIVKSNPLYSGTVTDPDTRVAGAFARVTTTGPTASRIEVYLYPTATVPALVRVVDPTAL